MAPDSSKHFQDRSEASSEVNTVSEREREIEREGGRKGVVR